MYDLCFQNVDSIVSVQRFAHGGNDEQKYRWLMGCWRCFVVSEQVTKRITVTLPQHILNELDGVIKNEKVNRSELILQATKMYLRERKTRQIREVMQQGYMEMAKINLNIASEAFLAEEEAEHTLDRLVSGV